MLAAVVVDLSIGIEVELDVIAILEVGDVAPRGLAHDVALRLGHAEARGALLELDGATTGGRSHLDQALGDVDVTVVVDADLTDNKAGVPRDRRARRRWSTIPWMCYIPLGLAALPAVQPRPCGRGGRETRGPCGMSSRCTSPMERGSTCHS